MNEPVLIPRPPVVREKLAANIREGRLLRSLLRLSIKAAEDRHRSQLDPVANATPSLAGSAVSA